MAWVCVIDIAVLPILVRKCSIVSLGWAHHSSWAGPQYAHDCRLRCQGRSHMGLTCRRLTANPHHRHACAGGFCRSAPSKRLYSARDMRSNLANIRCDVVIAITVVIALRLLLLLRGAPFQKLRCAAPPRKQHKQGRRQRPMAKNNSSPVGLPRGPR